MITDPDEIKDQLLKWAGELSNVEITESSLSLGGVSIDAKAKLSNGYSAASVFLQVRDPDIALMRYRNVCKEYKVDDPIKASDKPRIVAEFAGTTSSTAAGPEAEAKERSASSSGSKRPAPSPPKDKDRRKSSSSKRPPPPSSSKKTPRKKPDMVTTEQLFENLNGVVGKRSTGLSQIEAAIKSALSSDGFSVDTASIDEATKKRVDSIMSKEIPVGNSASILRSDDPRKDLKRVLNLYKEAVMVKGGSSKTASTPKTKVRAHLLGQKPVIVVPKGMTAPLTLLNAHSFLSEATFVPRDQVKSRNDVPTKFTRNHIEYDITDNPTRFFQGGTKDWDRIVAVIVLGQDWQFKDWIPGFNAPATLFERVFGYYIGDSPPSQWAVKQGQLHREKRGLDSITYTSFWSQLDEWMRVHKPELIPKSIGLH